MYYNKFLHKEASLPAWLTNAGDKVKEMWDKLSPDQKEALIVGGVTGGTAAAGNLLLGDDERTAGQKALDASLWGLGGFGAGAAGDLAFRKYIMPRSGKSTATSSVDKTTATPSLSQQIGALDEHKKLTDKAEKTQDVKSAVERTYASTLPQYLQGPGEYKEPAANEVLRNMAKLGLTPTREQLAAYDPTALATHMQSADRAEKALSIVNTYKDMPVSELQRTLGYLSGSDNADNAFEAAVLEAMIQDKMHGAVTSALDDDIQRLNNARLAASQLNGDTNYLLNSNGLAARLAQLKDEADPNSYANFRNNAVNKFLK